ncbi:MCE family protein [Gordonia rubripertincta]|uniref:MCE family protein n=1 Tax=Gordonia rubripertincta TaxID=36822 RepID=UPI000B8D2C4B|nr:MCE family protein [Gordonia rubripertincta]ASR03099.1 mce related protein [Gordonia rubripertincta]
MRVDSNIVKFLAFAVAMVLVTFGIVVVFGQLRFQSQSDYSAEFTNVSGLKSGEFVRIAGVEVGRVSSVSVDDNTKAKITFSLDKDVTLTQATRAVVRYRNLVGDRYLELREGDGNPSPLAQGSTIGIDQTEPALDLDALMGGFRPLFKALDPDQVNKLSSEIITVFQGQGGTIASVLSETADLTTSLADRDQLIGEVITNLNTLLGTVDKKDRQFDSMIDNLQQLTTGLANRADPIAGALTHISDASRSVASLLNATRPSIRDDVNQIRRVSTNVVDDREWTEGLLSRLPGDYQRLSRLGLYGDFFSFYLCDITIKVNGPDGNPVNIKVAGQKAGRCTP